MTPQQIVRQPSTDGPSLLRNFGEWLLARVIQLTQLTLMLVFGAPMIAYATDRPKSIQLAQLPTQVTPAAENGRRRVALVIGNSSYRNLVPLPNPTSDAQDLCSTLQRLSFEVRCVLDVRDRRTFREEVRKFASTLDANTVSFFYYAGHGVQYDGQNYLLPTDADIRSSADIDYEGIGLTYVLQVLADARSSPNIVILDACRDNPFRHRPVEFAQRGLARIEPPVGSFLVYATAPNKGALDGNGRNGLFTRHLLDHLETPGIKLDELFQMVAQGVEREAREAYRYEQTPFRSSSYSGAFCLAGCNDPGLTNELAEIAKQRDALSARLNALDQENQRLRQQAQQGANLILRLERQVQDLTAQASSHGQSQGDTVRRLEEARAELSRAKAKQDERERLERENIARSRDVELMRAELQTKSVELERYRQQVDRLVRERETQERSIQPQPAPSPPPKRQVIIPSL